MECQLIVLVIKSPPSALGFVVSTEADCWLVESVTLTLMSPATEARRRVLTRGGLRDCGTGWARVKPRGEGGGYETPLWFKAEADWTRPDTLSDDPNNTEAKAIFTHERNTNRQIQLNNIPTPKQDNSSYLLLLYSLNRKQAFGLSECSPVEGCIESKSLITSVNHFLDNMSQFFFFFFVFVFFWQNRFPEN